ncbi:hypothetical protein ACLB2K_011028 [Fragaria x ananassa]
MFWTPATVHCQVALVLASSTTSAPVQRLRGRRLSADAVVDNIPTPPITCVAVGMKKSQIESPPRRNGSHDSGHSNKKTPVRRITRPSPINSLDDDVLSIIFSLLDDCFDLINCSLVCKTWSSVITKSKLLAAQMGLVKGLCLEEMITES